MSKEENSSDTTLGLAIISLMIGKWILEVLDLICRWISNTAWSLSVSLGKFAKFIGPPLNVLAIIATLIAVCWAIYQIHQYVNRITEFRGVLQDKVSELKRDFFKEVEQIRESLFEKAWALEKQQLELEQKTQALMESIEARLKAPVLIESATLQEGAENTDSNVLPR